MVSLGRCCLEIEGDDVNHLLRMPIKSIQDCYLFIKEVERVFSISLAKAYSTAISREWERAYNMAYDPGCFQNNVGFGDT